MKITNYEEISGTEERKTVLEILKKGIESVLPEKVIQNNIRLDKNILKIKEKKFNLNDYRRIIIIGGGKASCKMAESISKILKEKISHGYVNSNVDKKVGNITINKASHPLPDEKGIQGVKEMIGLEFREDDLVMCLISGGGSAMLPMPKEGITLEDLEKTNECLLKAGANIYEINSIRKHISEVKGGKLAAKIYPATTISLIISDVIGDDLSVIASGPTTPDNSTFKDAIEVMEKYKLKDKMPENVMRHLKKEQEETIKLGDKIFEKVHNFILANNYTALKAMEEEAGKKGFNAKIITSELKGEAKEAGNYIAKEMINAEKGDALIFGGEPTVTVKGKGIGGRLQELILSMIEKIKDKNITIGAIGTDGTDFYKAAGAIADGKSFEKAENLKLSIKHHLEDNDSFNFFKKIKDHIITGNTGTNVADIIIGIKK